MHRPGQAWSQAGEPRQQADPALAANKGNCTKEAQKECPGFKAVAQTNTLSTRQANQEEQSIVLLRIPYRTSAFY